MGSLIRSIIDGNEAAARYCEYMRPARRDGDKTPRKVITDPERAGYVRDLNSYLDRIQVGYEAVAATPDSERCIKCHQPLPLTRRLKRCIYTEDGRIDLYTCATC